jgi:hypothetical protein
MNTKPNLETWFECWISNVLSKWVNLLVFFLFLCLAFLSTFHDCCFSSFVDLSYAILFGAKKQSIVCQRGQEHSDTVNEWRSLMWVLCYGRSFRLFFLLDHLFFSSWFPFCKADSHACLPACFSPVLHIFCPICLSTHFVQCGIYVAGFFHLSILSLGFIHMAYMNAVEYD